MRSLIVILILILVAAGFVFAAQPGKPPGKLVFPSKQGEVAFSHTAHVKREKGNCKACHDKLWPRSTKVPVTSAACRTCHLAGGKAFEMKGNCRKCHGAGGKAAKAARS